MADEDQLTAGATVCNIPELLEMILLHDDLDIKTLLLSQRTCKAFQATIAESKKLRIKLFMEVDTDATEHQSNPLLIYNSQQGRRIRIPSPGRPSSELNCYGYMTFIKLGSINELRTFESWQKMYLWHVPNPESELQQIDFDCPKLQSSAIRTSWRFRAPLRVGEFIDLALALANRGKEAMMSYGGVREVNSGWPQTVPDLDGKARDWCIWMDHRYMMKRMWWGQWVKKVPTHEDWHDRHRTDLRRELYDFAAEVSGARIIKNAFYEQMRKRDQRQRILGKPHNHLTPRKSP